MHEDQKHVQLEYCHDTYAIVHTFKQTVGNDLRALFGQVYGIILIFPFSSLCLMICDKVLCF